MSVISSIYDPIGLVSPFVLEGRKILQELCIQGADWDDAIPGELESRWRKFISLIGNLSKLKIKRCLHSHRSDIKAIEFHHFSDASFKGYGQCSYARYVYQDDSVSCSLIIAKSRVSPLKPVTVPRLELTAAVLSVKASVFLNSEMDYGSVKEYFWTDSMSTLAYIKNETRRFHIFVGNRVQSILNSSSSNQWHYVPSSQNPADEASRGLDLANVRNDDRWFKGPDFLYSPVISNFEMSEISLENDPEVKTQVLSSNVKPTFTPLLDRLTRFSSWPSAKKALCVCTRYRNILLNKVRDEKVKVHESYVTVEELSHVEYFILKLVQKSFFYEELCSLSADKCVKSNSSISNLNPFLCDDGLIRVGGRLKMSSLSYESKHPVVLPSAKLCHVSFLLIMHFHSKVCHQGRCYTVNELRNNGFWIIHCIANVSSVINKCIKCRKLYKSTSVQQMADLPQDRISESAPFSFSGVDFFGPFHVKEGRKTFKRYGVLFTCLSCRAIHVEVAHSLNTDSFINAFRRFTSIRGACSFLRMDRGTNFIGAHRELGEAVQEMDLSKIGSVLSRSSCQFTEFKFNKPHASHTGGVWERMIRSVRRIFACLLDNLGTHLDDESLRTFFCECAGMVNSRPLSVDSLSDANSPIPISPNSLLTMKSSVVMSPPGVFDRDSGYCKRRWRRCQYLANEFWSRFKSEYLQQLQPRSKWKREHRNFCIGDIIMLKDELTPRCDWSLCKVVEVYHGTDGKVRSVKLQIGNRNLDNKGKPRGTISYLDRSIHKCVLMLESESV